MITWYTAYNLKEVSWLRGRVTPLSSCGIWTPANVSFTHLPSRHSLFPNISLILRRCKHNEEPLCRMCTTIFRHQAHMRPWGLTHPSLRFLVNFESNFRNVRNFDFALYRVSQRSRNPRAYVQKLYFIVSTGSQCCILSYLYVALCTRVYVSVVEIWWICSTHSENLCNCNNKCKLIYPFLLFAEV